MRKNKKQIICLTLVGLLFISTSAIAIKTTSQSNIDIDENYVKIDKELLEKTISSNKEDLDPLIDLEITVTVKEIRALDDIDFFSDPDFYVKIFVNDEEFKSDVWQNKKYINEPWSTPPIDVPDDEEYVNIRIQLWDSNPGKDKLCDLGETGGLLKDQREVILEYSLKTGHWDGEDYVYQNPIYSDDSGYGRLNGCDDNSIYQRDRDCELWFDITQNDYDGDGIPYWTEVEVYGTDPEENDAGRDDDEDGIPIEWEHKWGHYFYYNWWNQTVEHRWVYHPFIKDDHSNLDPDEDGLDNVEEYLTSQWGSDPFRQDIFVEVDQMELGPNGEGALLPEGTGDLIRDPFARRNIVFHFDDDGSMGGGGELIPFAYETSYEELQPLYVKYFLHNNPNNWRRGVFRYVLILHNCTTWSGFVFRTRVNGEYLLDSLQISTKIHEDRPMSRPIINAIRRHSFNREVQRTIVYAGVIMHEIGHTLGISRSNTPGCDSYDLYLRYRSCMNYLYVYFHVDYSDGSNGKYDWDDWDKIVLTLFQD